MSLERLIEAAKSGDPDEVNRLLAIPEVLAQAAEPLNSALSAATENRHISIAVRLLDVPQIFKQAVENVFIYDVTSEYHRKLRDAGKEPAREPHSFLAWACKNNLLTLVKRILGHPDNIKPKNLSWYFNDTLYQAMHYSTPDIVSRILQIPSILKTIFEEYAAEDLLLNISIKQIKDPKSTPQVVSQAKEKLFLLSNAYIASGIAFNLKTEVPGYGTLKQFLKSYEKEKVTQASSSSSSGYGVFARSGATSSTSSEHEKGYEKGSYCVIL